jgi:hypothetical protein
MNRRMTVTSREHKEREGGEGGLKLQAGDSTRPLTPLLHTGIILQRASDDKNQGRARSVRER